MAPSITPALTLVFQASFDQGQVPEDWKRANVTPLFKKGDKSKAANYRPVSLTSTCCKIMEHIVHSHLMNFLESNNILSDYQHGFRKKRSCETQLLVTVHDLAAGLDRHHSATMPLGYALNWKKKKKTTDPKDYITIINANIEFLLCTKVLVTEITCSFNLVPKKDTSKKIKW